MTNITLNRTPFYNNHVKLGGKIVDFFGWELPVQYSTITLEHTAVRTKAGVFDISHMGQVMVWGEESLQYLQNLLTNDISKIGPGKSIYAHMLNEKGGVIDDLFVYQLEESKYLVIINASRRTEDMEWMTKHQSNFQVELLEVPFGAALAIQGPASSDIMMRLNSEITKLPRFGIGEFEIGDLNIHVARTGYTGEDGFEFFAPAGHLLLIWDLLFKAGHPLGLIPCGLGARDTLRTEVAYPLYGHELDEHHTPFEAGLGWVVKLDKPNFIGKEALVQQKANGCKEQLLGFKVEKGGVARPGGEIWLNGQKTGTVASGTFSPSLNMAIGMAYFPISTPKTGQTFTIKQGSRELEAVTTALPFYKKK